MGRVFRRARLALMVAASLSFPGFAPDPGFAQSLPSRTEVTQTLLVKAALADGSADVQSMVSTVDGLWFVALDHSRNPARAAVYLWSADGTAEIPGGCGPDQTVPPQLTADSGGVVWLLGSCGVFRYDGSSFQSSPEFTALRPKGIVGGASAWVITNGAAGDGLPAADDRVLYLPSWDTTSAQLKSIPVHGSITRWTTDTAGNLYFTVRTTAGDRLFQLSPSVFAATEIALPAALPVSLPTSTTTPVVSAIYSGTLSDLWISAADGQLLRYLGGEWTAYTNTGSPLTALGEDSDRNLYLIQASATAAQSAYLTIPYSFRLQPQGNPRIVRLTPATGALHAVAADFTGTLWIGAQMGAWRVAGANPVPWDQARAAQRDAARQAAARARARTSRPPATPATGIVDYAHARYASLFSTRGLANDQVSSIAVDSQGRLYFTTGYTNLVTQAPTPGSGVSRWDHRVFQTFTTASGLASNTVQCSFFDSTTNTVWFGTDNGISRLTPAASTDTFATNILAGVNIRAIARDASGNIWAGTYGNGVYELNSTTGATIAQFTKANTSAGLVDDHITSLAFEDSGSVLWVGTDRGVPVISGTSTDTTAKGGISRLQLSGSVWTPVNLNGPLGNIYFDANRVNSVVVDSSNNVWVAVYLKGVFRITAGSSLTLAASYTHFGQATGLGGNALDIIFSICRDKGNNLWFSFGGFGNATAAVSFLPASQLSAASPAFVNYNNATNGFPNNFVNAMFAEDAGTMWFGTLGAGVYRLGCPCDEPGFPVTLDGYVYTSSPVLADLEGLGKLDIVVGDQAGKIYAYRPDGSQLWKYDARLAFPAIAANSNLAPFLANMSIQSSASVGDVDGDGLPEVVVGLGGFVGSNDGPTLGKLGKSPGALLILSNAGVLKNVFYTYDITDYSAVPVNGVVAPQDGLPEPIYGTPTLANTDDDPELEIHVGAWDGFFYAVNANGSPIYTVDNDGDGLFDEDFLSDFTPYHPFDTSQRYPGWKGVDDDYNGQVDEGNIPDDDEDGLQDEDWPEFPFWAGDTTSSSAVVADINGTGSPNIIFGQDYAGSIGNVTVKYKRGGILRNLTTQGTEQTGFPEANLEQVILSSPALVDLGGDGDLEIVHGSGLDLSTVGTSPTAALIGQLIYAWKKDGSSFLPGGTGKFATTVTPNVTGAGGQVAASLAIGDLNQTGSPNLVAVTSVLVNQSLAPIDESGNPIPTDQIGANAIGQMVYAFKADGSLLPGFPVRPFAFSADATILGSPIIADVNGDGYPDIVVPAGYGLIVIDRNGKVLSGMGDFENLQDPDSAIFQESSPAIADIDGDGKLEVVWASGISTDGGATATSGVLRVAKLAPVNASVYEWPEFQRDAERNPIYDVHVSRPQARLNAGGTQVILTAQVMHGRNKTISSVVADLSAIGGSAAQQLFDNGTNGDAVANDGIYSFSAPVATTGRYYLTVTATDAANRTASGTITYVQRGTGKILTGSASSIDFGTVGQGLDGDRHLNLMNIGDTALTIASVASTDAAEFFVAPARSAFSDRAWVSPGMTSRKLGFDGVGNQQTTTALAGWVIQPGDVLNLIVRAHPALTSTGEISSTLTIASDGGTVTVQLSATARVLASALTVAITDSGGHPSSTLAFPGIPIGTSVPQIFFIDSKGADPLIVSNITFDNPAYSIYKPDNPTFPRTYPSTLAPGDQYSGNRYTQPYPIEVKFAPTQIGPQNGTMKLFTTDPVTPVFCIPLVGAGNAPPSTPGAAGASLFTHVSAPASTGCSQTISFGPLSNRTIGSTVPPLSATASSGLPVAFGSNTPNVCGVSGTTVTILISGGCSITATQIGNTVFAAAAPVTQSFTIDFSDVSGSDYYYNAVDLLAQHGITSGCGSDDYCATQNVTRAQMAIFMVRAVYGGDKFTSSTTPYFTDVQPADFGFKWIQKLFELGITSGCGVGLYCPNDSVTRDQMAIFIIRVRLGSTAAFSFSSTPSFTDEPDTDFAFKWVQRMKQENITSGCGTGTYCPNNPVIRGDMAIFIMRGAFNQLLPAGTPVLSEISSPTLAQGASGAFTLTGVNTNFVQGTTTISPIPGVTIGTITVTSPTSLTVELTAAADAVQRPYSILAVTGTEEAVLPNGLAIQ